MKAPLALSLFAAALLGAAIYFEEGRISELKKQVAVHQANAADMTGKLSRLTTQIEDLERQLKQSKAVADQLQAALGKRNGSASPDGSAQAAAPGAKEGGGAKWMQGIAKMFTDPEMRKTMRSQQMLGIRMMYGDLAKELALSAQESEQLLEVLADRQMDMSAAGMKALDPNNPDSEAEKQRLAENTKRYDDQIKAMLGDDKYAQLKTYEGSMGDRFMLQQFEGQFGAAGAPLESNQKQQLLTLMREERVKTPPDSNLANTSNPAQQMEALKDPEKIDRYVNSQQEFQKRVLERSRQILNADQVAAFEKVQQQQLEFMRMQMKMSRQMLGLDK